MEMINKLDLTDAQKTQIETINNSTADNKEKHSQIKALLTQDQQAQLKTLMSQWKAAHPPGGAPPPPAN